MLAGVPDRRALLAALGLGVATLVCFWGVRENAFVNYDDDLYITERPEVAAGLGRDTLAWAFTSTQGANWFPLTRLSWLLDAELFGVDARAFHTTSLLLHVANALLLFAALRRLTGEGGASAFVAGVFALHPLHVESVAWAAARKDVLAGLFFMLALLAHERVARSARPWSWGALLALCCALGLMAKPVLVTLPCVLLLLDFWPLSRLARPAGGAGGRQLARVLLEKLPLFALAAAASAVTLAAQRAGGALQDASLYPLWIRVGNFCEALAATVGQAFWPRGLAVFYPHPLANLSPWRVAIGAWLLVGVSLWALRRAGRRPAVAVGWLWFVGMLIPSSGLLQVGQAARADRYTYLPLIGLAIALAWGAREAAARWPALRVGVARGGLVALLLLGLASAQQVTVWRSSRTLFEHALAVTRHNHVAHINLGLALHRAGRPAQAEPHLTQAVAIAPASAAARGIRGEVRLALRRPAEAEPDFRTALRLEPGSARWTLGLGRALLELERAGDALEALGEALAAQPEASELHALLGLALVHSGRGAEARPSLERALADEARLLSRFGPAASGAVHAQLALDLANAGSFEPALRHLVRAGELAPERADYRASQGELLQALGREAEAVAAYRAALAGGVRSLRVLNNLGWLLAAAADPQLHAPAEAVALAREAAAQSGHTDPAILDTLATAYAAAGREAEALEAAGRALALAEAQGRAELARGIRARFPALSPAPGAAPCAGAAPDGGPCESPPPAPPPPASPAPPDGRPPARPPARGRRPSPPS
jgi:tetratricopeptide (TPR) repeat protein